MPTKWEAVVRYGDFDSPLTEDDQAQWAIGIDYWFAANAAGKVAYEFNDGEAGAGSDNDRVLVQLAYGF